MTIQVQGVSPFTRIKSYIGRWDNTEEEIVKAIFEFLESETSVISKLTYYEKETALAVYLRKNLTRSVYMGQVQAVVVDLCERPQVTVE